MLQIRCKKKIEKEQCILVENHKGRCRMNWITQKEINKRLVKCGYGYSMYPANWWSKKQLIKTENIMKAIKQLEKAMERKVTLEEFSFFFGRNHNRFKEEE